MFFVVKAVMASGSFFKPTVCLKRQHVKLEFHRFFPSSVFSVQVQNLPQTGGLAQSGGDRREKGEASGASIDLLRQTWSVQSKYDRKK